MESIEKKIKKFILLDCTSINGSGDGYGNGNGNGYGNGDGYGNGNRSGYGYEDGSGDGIKSFNGNLIYNIDSTKTIITSIRGNIARGFILNTDLSTSPCFIVKNNYCFSHGKTLKEALFSLEKKSILKIPIDMRINNFKKTFTDFNKKIKCSILYDWHYILTGSCKMGRDSFCQTHKINLKKDKCTIFEFIELTKNSYGSEIIKKLLT